MSIEERKQQLHSYIEMIDDEDVLEMIIKDLSNNTSLKKDILDGLTPEQLPQL